MAAVKKAVLTLLVLMFALPPAGAWAVRLKDIATFEGSRVNQLIGYGLIVGLNGTGDKTGTTFTMQSLTNMLKHLGIQVSPSQVRVKNVAAVMVTADLPPFLKPGTKIDVLISSLGDATSLQGGTLMVTPLTGLDGNVYAVAQGPISIGGFSVSGAAADVQKNHPTVGRIARGATIERAVNPEWPHQDHLQVKLSQPDFTTALRVSNRINEKLTGAGARPVDAATIDFEVPGEFREKLAVLVAELENTEIEPDAVAKVIIDERTGTIVIGENVRIATVAVAHGALTIQVREGQRVSQPGPLAPEGAQTVVTPETEIKVQEENRRLLLLEGGPTISDLVKALNAIGATPRDLIVIFQAIKAAGALHAELEII